MAKIEQDQIFLNNLVNRFKFHYLRGRGHLLAYAWNRFQWYRYPPLGIVSKFPPHVDVEISTQCNMECPMCYRKTDKFREKVKFQFMEQAIFEKIIRECAKHKLFSIRLSLRGEPFIHPQIFDFIELAKGLGIKETSALTNGLALTPEKFERLVKLKFDWLTISFDGLGLTYEAIRKPAKFREAFEKIKSYSQIKKKQRSLKPAIRVQTVWPAIKDNPQEFYSTFSPYVDSIVSNPLIDFLDQDTQIQCDQEFRCPYLYQRLVIGADGRVILCSSDEYGECTLGDIRQDSIYDIWHGQKLSQARMWFKEKSKKWWEYPPCSHCCYPRRKEQSGDVFIDGRRVNIQKYVDRSEEISLESAQTKV